MNNDGDGDDSGVQSVLQSLQAMKPEPAKPRAASYRGIPKPTPVAPRFHRKADGDARPDALLQAQQLQLKVADLTRQLAAKGAQCDELHACVTSLNKELRLAVDHASLLAAAGLEKDKEVHTLRAHVDDLYLVQQQLRAESLQFKVALSRRGSDALPSVTDPDPPIAGQAPAPPPPPREESVESLDAPPTMDDTLACLRHELAQLEAQMQERSQDLQRTSAEGARLVDHLRQWHETLGGASAPSTTDALVAAVAAGVDGLVVAEIRWRREASFLRIDRELTARRVAAEMAALRDAAARAEKAVQNEAAKCALWETQCAAVQEALEALSDRWEATSDDRAALEAREDELLEQLRVVHDDAKERDEALATCHDDLREAREALAVATAHCELMQSELTRLQQTRAAVANASPGKAAPQWLGMLEAVQAHHELDVELLHADVAAADRRVRDRDAEIDLLQSELEASRCAMGKLLVDRDLARVADTDEWVAVDGFAASGGGRLLALACDVSGGVESACQTDGAPLLEQLHAATEDLVAQQQRRRASESALADSVGRENALRCELQAAHGALHSKTQALAELWAAIGATRDQLGHVHTLFAANEAAREGACMLAEETRMKLWTTEAALRAATQDAAGRQEALKTQVQAAAAHEATATTLRRQVDQLHMSSADLEAQMGQAQADEQVAPKTQLYKANGHATALERAAEDAEQHCNALQCALADAAAVHGHLSERLEVLVAAKIADEAQVRALEELLAESVECAAVKSAALREAAERSAMDTEAVRGDLAGTAERVARKEEHLVAATDEKRSLLAHVEAQAAELLTLLGLPAKEDERPNDRHHRLVAELETQCRQNAADVARYQATVAALEAEVHALRTALDQRSRAVERHLPPACIDRRLGPIAEVVDDSDDEGPDAVWTQYTADVAALRSALENMPTTDAALEALDDRLQELTLRRLPCNSAVATALHGTQGLVASILLQRRSHRAVDKATNYDPATDDDDDSGAEMLTPTSAATIRCWDAEGSTPLLASTDNDVAIAVVVVLIGAHEVQAGVVRPGVDHCLPELRLPATEAALASAKLPLTRFGAVVDFAAYEASIKHVLRLLRVSAAKHKLVLLHKAAISPLEKERIVDVAIAGCRVAAVNLVTHAQVALVAAGCHTGLVVDLGLDTIYVVPIFEDMVLEHAVVKLPTGGKDLPPTDAAAVDALLLHEQNGGVGLSTAILKALCLATPVIHPTLVRHIILCGGPAVLPGLGSRLREELVECLGPIDTVSESAAVAVHVVANTFHGACVHAQTLSSYKWISRADYAADGATIVHTKCF
ncbi:hypothetical protein ACHHYP_00816 [Achlya hypogyna]|uniref:Uncharacterized protein n=1 Tax=Achlya hypogyna TaxID=1202772 RepID=A0A1V9ZAB2_ACHHY|nr:hypothetical protein ACHHYP_00816 [Achlya hypogyna]